VGNARKNALYLWPGIVVGSTSRDGRSHDRPACLPGSSWVCNFLRDLAGQASSEKGSCTMSRIRPHRGQPVQRKPRAPDVLGEVRLPHLGGVVATLHQVRPDECPFWSVGFSTSNKGKREPEAMQDLAALLNRDFLHCSPADGDRRLALSAILAERLNGRILYQIPFDDSEGEPNAIY
jgi:hypothetical protein